MAISRKQYKAMNGWCFLWIAGIVTLLLSCVVPSDVPKESFHFDQSGSRDSVAPYGSMVVTFTEPVSDSSTVDFIFSPVFLSYAMEFSPERDTVIVRFSAPLSGGTDYTIHLREPIYSLNGSVFNPGDDSILITTVKSEQEPNDRAGLADTLSGRCFGSVAMVNDTDWFVVPLKVRELYCHSYNSRTTFFIRGLHGSSTIREYAEHDTITIADTVSLPLYVAVHAYLRSVGGYYEVGSITRED